MNINTSTHYVFSKKWYSEEPGQYSQVGFHARKALSEATALCGEASKGSGTHDAMWMTTQNVVLFWIQLGCLHQLSREIDRGLLIQVKFVIDSRNEVLQDPKVVPLITCTQSNMFCSDMN